MQISQDKAFITDDQPIQHSRCATNIKSFLCEDPKRITGKQYRPRSYATEGSVWSGSSLFANSLTIFSRNI